MKTLLIRVKEVKGHCDIHKVGDYFRLEGGKLSFPESNKYVYIRSCKFTSSPSSEAKEDR